MKAGGRSGISHLVAALMGFVGIASIRLWIDPRSAIDSDAGRLPPTTVYQLESLEASGTASPSSVRLSSADFREMLDSLASISLTSTERWSLRDQLLREWVDRDPESLLPWLEKRPWLTTYSFPDFSELARRKPELLFSYVVKNGDPRLLKQLIESNPEAALEILKNSGVPADEWAGKAMTAGLEADPGFSKHLEEIEDPDGREDALQAYKDFLESYGRHRDLAELWKQHPELVDTDSLRAAISGHDFLSDGVTQSMTDLLPGESSPLAPNRPLEILAFVDRLQATYLPGDSVEEWRRLFAWQNPDSDGYNGFENYAALKAVAKGDRSPENLKAASDWWMVQSRRSSGEIEDLSDPVFRDFCIEKAIREGVSDASEENSDQIDQQLLSQISDPVLAEKLNRLIARRKERAEKNPNGDPFAPDPEEDDGQ